ncbi:polyprenyl synthetase family protein [Streptomyces sp. tea 10]|nr:polyprenyl synthetase family protein [Streptomyces sp. tea 10]
MSVRRIPVAVADVPLPQEAGLVERLALDSPDLGRRLRAGMEQAEKLLVATTQDTADPRIAEATGHLARAGGKRLRPLLVLLGAEFGTPWCAGVTEAAVVAELVHIASLHHDDVMDHAPLRHGVPSVHARFGAPTAVFSGDWLLARGARMAADLSPAAFRLHAATADRLVAGQLLELTGPTEGEDEVDHYFRVLSGKTAALLSMSLGIGALQAGAPEEHVAALTGFGEELGVAFQIADDLLDMCSTAGASGKERGRDLLAGVPTLPVLLALTGGHPQDAELRELLAAGPVPEESAARALELFARSPALAESEAALHHRLGLARAAVGPLPELPAKRALLALCDYVAVRTS